MMLAMLTVVALSSGGRVPSRPVWDARTAIQEARTCWKLRPHLGRGHAILEHGGWRVWFGKDPKRPLCDDAGAIVAADGSKTDCMITVC